MQTPLRVHAWRAFAPMVFIAGLLASHGFAAIHQIRNAAEFNSLPALNAGDVVILHDGIYGALDKTVVSNIADDVTAQTDPIYVVAASPGGVRVAAPSRITLRGRGIVLAGLDFVAGAGMRDNGTTSPAWIIRTDINSRHMRISHVRFDHCTAGDNYGNWILLSGFNNAVEYCSFIGQNEPVSGATLSIVRSVSEAGIDVPRNHVVRYNYFGPRLCSVADNGYETIRIGDSGSQAHDMGVTIERNVFYRSIWRNDGVRPNEPEIISNKSKGNFIRYNTFLESYGQITLRHGDNCVVEGNFVFGGGYYDGPAIALSAAPNVFQSGVRVIGQHHIVRNNYFVNLRGTGERAAVAVYAGYPGFNDGNGSGGDSTYEAAHYLQLYHNTFIDCRELRFGSAPRVEMTESPIGVTVYNNAWQGGTGGPALMAEAGFVPGDSGGNYFYRPAGDYGWTGLTGTYSSTVSPQITESFNQYLIPTNTSPLLDVADGTLSADDDIRGATRPAMGRDIGSFERESAGGDNRPLLRNEVGAVFDGGSAGTYPQPPDFPLTILTTTLPIAKTTKAYPGMLQAFGGTAPLTWSLVGGALPDGLTLDPLGVITGTPTIPGMANFTVRVTDATDAMVEQPLSLTVVTNSVPTITTASLPNGEGGSPYMQTIQANSGDPIALWSVADGALPPGLLLGQAGLQEATLSGTPTAAGTYSFTLRIEDEDGDFATQAFDLVISPFAPTIPVIVTPPVGLNVAANANASFSVEAAGLPPLAYQWRKNSVDLPGETDSVLTLTNVTAADAGSYSVRVTNPHGAVTSAGVALTVTTTMQNILLHDAFDDGERLTQNLPASARWYGNNSTVLSVPANALSLNPNGNGLAYFTDGTPWTLAIGESLQATFDLTFEGSALPAGNDLFRVSLLNSHGTSTDHNATMTANRVAADSYSSATLAFRNNSGYMAGAAFVPATASGLRFFSRNYEASNTISGTASHTTLGPLGGTGGFGFVPNATYAATFAVRRATATTTVLTLSFQGTFANGTTGTWSHTLTDNTGQPTYTFDMLVFFVGTGGGLTSARVDNIRVGTGVPATTPAITLQPQSQVAGLGANLTLTAAAAGDPAPTLQWQKNGVDIPGATGAALALTNIAAGDAGDYTVVATNAAGAVTSEIAVVTVYDPFAPALSFGGIDLVTANQNMRGLSAGAVAFSEQTPVSPLSGYVGPLFHGAAFVKNGAVIDQWNVFNDDVNGDSLRFRMPAPPLNATSVGIFLWKREAFNSPYNSGTPVDLATEDAALSYTGRRFGTAVGSELRFIVQEGDGSYLVSAAAAGGIPANFGTVTLTNPVSTQWFAYDPVTDTIGPALAPDLSSILAAGVRLQVIKTGTDGGAITAALSEFRVVAGSSIPTITGSLDLFGVVGRPISHAVVATNAPTSYIFGTLPDGLSADENTGVISGIPTTPGVFPITVQPANASGVGSVATLLLSIARVAEGVIPLNGLVSNFEFSGNANDLAANRGGTVYGATLGEDRFGRANSAYVFDGISQYLEIPDNDDFSVSTTGALTISVWMRPDALVFPKQQGSGYVHWMGKGEIGQHEWTFRMYGAGNSEGRENRTSFYLFNATGGEGAGSYVQEPVAVGEWIHYVAVVDSAADTITWYKNGVQKDQDPFHNSIYNIIPTNGTAPLRLGTRDLGSYFKGAIDDLRIYNRVLTLEEIQQLYGDNLGINRAPVGLELSNNTLPLAAAGAGSVVGTLTTSDPDEGDAHVYTLSGVGSDVFALSGETLVVGGSGLSAGSHDVLVRTTDQGGLFFERLVSITVAQGIPFIIWNEPAPITYGTPLSSAQLNATATGLNGVALTGTFAYSPGPGALLDAGAARSIEVVFTPTGSDAINYTTAAATVSLTVNQAAPVIAWPAPVPIQYGTPLSALQLNAEARGIDGMNLQGIFEYSPAAGTVLAAGAAQPLAVWFTPTGAAAPNYREIGGSVSISVQKAQAAIFLDGLHQNYDGSPKPVEVETAPDNLPVLVTYDGSPLAPIYPGDYEVVATVDDPNHTGSATGVLTISATGVVRQMPTINGGVLGSIQVLQPGNVTMNGSSWISGDILVPGTPKLQVNGQPVFAGVIEATGSASPTNHKVTLNSGSVLRHLVTHVDPVALPIVSAPPTPVGTRNVSINNAGQSAGDFSTLRNLTLNSNAGQVAVPQGSYGSFTANSGTSFIFGNPDAIEPAIYNFQTLTLNSNATLHIVGPVIITLANAMSVNGTVGDSAHPDWLTLRVASGGVTLNNGATVHGIVIAPTGTVTVNGNATLQGNVRADRLTINGNGLLQELP